MKKSLFYIGLLAIGAFLATLAVRKHSTLNHNQVPAMAEVQLASETTTPVESAQAQTRTVTIRLAGLTPVAPGQTNNLSQ